MKWIQANGLALVGGIAGGLIGYLVFFWLAGYGMYAMVVPGGLVGLGASLVKNRSIIVAIVCGLGALLLGLFTEWRFAPFVADESLGYFVAHVFELSPVTLLMIAGGALIGFWCPFRNRAGVAINMRS